MAKRGGNDDLGERVLTAAAPLFAEQGYNATAIPQMCGAAGVGIGTFYAHFAGKSAVATELAERAHERLLTWIDSLDFGELEHLERAVGELLAAPSAGLERALTEAEAMVPTLRALRHEQRRAAREHVAAAIEKARGQQRTEGQLVDAGTAAWAFLGLVHAAIIDAAHDGQADIARLIHRIAVAG